VENLWPEYVEAVVRELQGWSPWLQSRSLHSVYFGGGTPSLIGQERIGTILNCVRSNFRLERDAEITVEANPETLSETLLQQFRQAGVNRISMGVQSFHPGHLQCLNRQHDGETVHRAVEWTTRAGIDNLSLDLIYGIPGQTLEDWQEDVQSALALGPQHLSTYELTLEPHTPLGQKVKAGEVSLPGEEAVIAMYEWTGQYLPEQGFEHYEISNFEETLPDFGGMLFDSIICSHFIEHVANPARALQFFGEGDRLVMLNLTHNVLNDPLLITGREGEGPVPLLPAAELGEQALLPDEVTGPALHLLDQIGQGHAGM